MKEKERDTLDELFRSKLYDFEAETAPGDWEAIAGRLAGSPSVPFRRKLFYWSAAAAVALLVVTGGVYWFRADRVPAPVAQEIAERTEEVKTRLQETQEPSVVRVEEAVPVAPVASKAATIAGVSRRAALGKGERRMAERSFFTSLLQSGEKPEVDAGMETERQANWLAVEKEIKEKATSDDGYKNRPVLQARRLSADAETAGRNRKESGTRKWGFGMGAGGLSVGASNIVPQYVTNSYTLRSESLVLLNAVSFNDQDRPKTDIHHKTPVSFGVAVSRYVSDRFSLQTGVTYTLLSSDWKTNGEPYFGKTEQKLHFIGIPLSAVYKIAEWNRFNVYAAAGGTAEINVAGKRKIRLFSDTEEMGRTTEDVRMKEWQWSVNARAGISYPLIRFVSAFAEVGAAYYFDNGSPIETVRSEKPFNVSLQFGFRLGF